MVLTEDFSGSEREGGKPLGNTLDRGELRCMCTSRTAPRGPHPVLGCGNELRNLCEPRSLPCEMGPPRAAAIMSSGGPCCPCRDTHPVAMLPVRGSP